jgi:serine/threonine protein kinase
MSLVFVARDESLGRNVVIKILMPELAATLNVERFTREIKLVAKLQQANIVPVLTAGAAGALPFYSMPFIEGLSLRQRMQQGPQPGLGESVRILGDIARALEYAHEHGVVHRDIKPENVLLSGGTAVVTDFGIAKAINAALTQPRGKTLTGAGSSVGTPGYMSPEQARGDVEQLDTRSDTYSLGALLRSMLTVPVGSKMTRPLAAICGKATAEIPAVRYQSVPELAQDVSRYLDGLAVGAHRENLLERGARFYGRNRFFILLIAAYLVMRVLILVFLKR